MTDNGPEKKGTNGEGDRNDKGQFVKGWPGGPGRKPGIKVSFRTAARQRAKDMDIDLDKEIGTLALLLIKQAKEGDVQAAKFVVERLCGLLKQEIEMKSESTVYLPDQARADLREMAKDKDLQAIQRAELVRRTNGKA